MTADRYQVGTVLCVQDKEMKQAWCLAASSTSATSRALMSLYGKRWGIECGLRNTDQFAPRDTSGICTRTPGRLWKKHWSALASQDVAGTSGLRPANLTSYPEDSSCDRPPRGRPEDAWCLPPCASRLPPAHE